MTVAIQVFTDVPQHTSNVIFGEGTDDAIEIQVRLTWRKRTASWYMDLLETDDTPIVLGRRITPQWAPLAGLALEKLPRDLFVYIDGPDDAVREDLGVPGQDGKRLFILLIPRDELTEIATTDLGITATYQVP